MDRLFADEIMQFVGWDPVAVAFGAGLLIVGTLLGHFIAAPSRNRQIRELGMQLEQVRQALAESETRGHVIEERLRQSEAHGHALEVEHGRIEAQLQAGAETREQLATALHEHKQAGAELRARLDQDTQHSLAVARQLERAQAENQGLMQQLADTRDTLARQSRACDELQAQLAELRTEQATLQTTLAQREEHFREQTQQLADSRKLLSQEFENLANRIFEEKGKTFTQTSQSSLDTLLKPFREQIDGFQKRINEIHDASLQGNTSLGAEIRKVLDIGLQMSKEASNLTSALKGDSQQRGAWGEAQLRRTLEMSGLLEDAHYEVQRSFKDAEGRHRQTDYLIRLPDGKHIIIDSKVSLLAYDRAVSADSPDEYQNAIIEHVKAVRRHIDDLASKDYTNLVGMRSPSFVLMFMPIEPAYIEALKNTRDLFEYGYSKNIVLVSHTTLIPILRTVSNLWMIERSNAEAREIGEKAGDIYNQICLVAERLQKLGGTLNTAGNHFNDTIRALAGKQGLYGKVERFSRLSAKISKTLPALEPIHTDFEAERLSLIVEALDEELNDPDTTLRPPPEPGVTEQP